MSALFGSHPSVSSSSPNSILCGFISSALSPPPPLSLNIHLSDASFLWHYHHFLPYQPTIFSLAPLAVGLVVISQPEYLCPVDRRCFAGSCPWENTHYPFSFSPGFSIVNLPDTCCHTSPYLPDTTCY
uniref:Putative serine/threonine-protein kinase At1g54610 n=1 Tax=Rhizophora mucronata TaxID=61149 RepID=A0A2P2K3U4_RHIMU